MEFTINDVNAWLDCSKDAGKTVWMDSNFAKAMTAKAMHEEGLAVVFGRGERVLEPSRSSGHVSAFGAEEEAWNTVLEVQEWIKTTSKEKGNKFIHIGQFINYVKKTIKWRLTDKVLGRGHEEPPPSLPASEEGDEPPDVIGNVEDPRAAEEYDKLFLQKDLVQCQTRAKSLMDCFTQSPFATQATRKRIDLLFQCSGILSALGVLVFIEQTMFHIVFKNKAETIPGSDFNQNTWNSYNFRLKDQWFKFLESDEKGKELNEGFKECREWLKEIIS